MQETGKILVILGVILIAAGAILLFMQRAPFLGRLPGDICIQRKNFSFYFPLTTSILLSLFVSLLFWLWPRR